jgi:excisionase family DNA binding protein
VGCNPMQVQVLFPALPAVAGDPQGPDGRYVPCDNRWHCLPCKLADDSYNGGMSTMSAIPGFCTVEETSGRINRSQSSVLRYIREGRLPAVSVGKSWLVHEAAILAFSPPPMGNPNLIRRDVNA